MATEQRAFPPFRVPGGVAIARPRQSPKYLVQGAGLPEDDHGDNHGDDLDLESDSDEEDAIGCVIVVNVPNETTIDQGGIVNNYVFTLFHDQFKTLEHPTDIKEYFYNSDQGGELHKQYNKNLPNETKNADQFMTDHIEIVRNVYEKTITGKKITKVHEYTEGGGVIY